MESSQSNIPENLDIGDQLINWNLDAAFKGVFDCRLNTLSVLPFGKTTVTLHKQGISLWSGTNTYPIHRSQIIDLRVISLKKHEKIDKLILPRVMAGSILFGPTGGFLSGISGFGSKSKLKNKHYFVIDFWETHTKSLQTILISNVDRIKIDSFIARYKKEIALNSSLSKERTNFFSCLLVIFIILCIVGIFITILSQSS